MKILIALAFALTIGALFQAGGNGGGHTPVTICHHAGPNPDNWHTITVDDDSVTLTAHLGHGDTLGPCEGPVPTQFATPSPDVTPTPTPSVEPTPTPRPTPTSGTIPSPVTETPAPTLPATDTE